MSKKKKKRGRSKKRINVETLAINAEKTAKHGGSLEEVDFSKCRKPGSFLSR